MNLCDNITSFPSFDKDNNRCPICYVKLNIIQANTSYYEYKCQESLDHFWVQRIFDYKYYKIKIRINDKNKRFYLRIHYDDGFLEVWTSDTYNKKIRIDKTCDVIHLNKTQILNKIKTYLMLC